MAYTFTRTDGIPVTIQDETLQSIVRIGTETKVSIPGRRKIDYGQDFAKSLYAIVQNCAGTGEPSSPLQGQLWFDSNVGNLKVNKSSTATANWKTIVTDDFTGTINATAIRAKYADLAERYHADKVYEFGTVVKLGGVHEITETTVAGDTSVFGVVSKSPAYMMNADAGNDSSHPYIALVGRTPVKVIGSVKKGDRLISSEINGVAIAAVNGMKYSWDMVIGRALADKMDTSIGLVETVVGTK